MPLLENLAEGFANAAGATGAAASIEKQKAHRQNVQDMALEDTVQAHMDVMKGIQAKLGQNPNDTQAQQALTQERQQLFNLLHQNEQTQPGKVAQLFRHIFRQGDKPQPVNNLPSVANLTAGAPVDEFASLSPADKIKHIRIKAGLDAPASRATTKYTPEDSFTADGKRIKIFRNPADPADVVDSAGQQIPEEVLKTLRPAPKTTKGLKYDPSTDQVVDQDTGQRYPRKGENQPPEVAAMFSGAEAMQKKKEDFQLRMAATRGTAYNASRPISVFDSAEGNAPTEVPFSEFAKSPGRYVPAGSGAKAIAQENLMQDIMGTSKLTREAITGLKEDFPLAMKAKIALAMKADDPHSAIDSLIASGALGTLTDDQQNFLVATRQLAENAMAMRTILGAGQGSEDVRDAVRATLPTLLSPDKAYATKQLDAFDKTIARLHRGVPRVKLGGDDTSGGSDDMISVQIPGHPAGKIHKSQKDAFLKKYPNATVQ